MYNQADFAVTLPNAFPSPGQVLQQGIALKEKQQERNDALAERQREFEQRNLLAKQEHDRANKVYNLKQIQDATAQKQYETPNHIIDGQIADQLSTIKNDAMKYIGESPEFVQQLIGDRVNKVAQWTDLAKQHAQQIAAQTTEFNKTLPNTDLNAVTGVTTQQFKDNFLNKDDKGNYLGLKDPHLIPQTVNYLDPFKNPNTLAGVTNNTAPLDEFMAKIPKNAFEKDSYTNNKGFVVSKKIGGYETPYSQLSTDANGSPIMEAKYNVAPAPLTGENGQPLKLATPELKSAMDANPMVSASFNKRWEDYKAQKKLSNLDPHTDDILKENFRYNFANQNLGHHVKEVEVQKVPVPKITINTGGANGVQIKDVYGGIKESLSGKNGGLPINELQPDAQEAVLSHVRKVTGNDKIGQADIGIFKDSNGNPAVYHIEKNSKGEDIQGGLISPLNKYAIDAKVNTSTKQKQALIQQEKATQQPSMITVVLNGKEGQIPSDKIDAFMKKYPTAKKK